MRHAARQACARVGGVKRPLLLACASLLGTALAATRVPGTYTYYSFQRDPITDANISSVVIDEVNDTAGRTAFAVRCSDRDRPALWASLTSKNDLLSAEDAALGLKPALTIRLGDDPPVVLRDSDLVTVVDRRDDLLTRNIGLQGPVVRQIVSGLNAGKRLVVRVNRLSGGQALTYVFPATGFGTAWAGVRACESRAPASASSSAGFPPAAPRTAAGTAATGVPKFTEWYFTTCRDAASGAARAGLTAGRAHLCELVIDTVPNGARPVAAEFRYELEYREGGVTGKLTLPGVDSWPSRPGGTVTRFRQEGSRLIFTLPLNVRSRADRVYTSLNVTGKVTFDNGGSKSVYEPLPVRPVN